MSTDPAKPFPFDLPVEGSILHCQKLLRTIPGKRLIISGIWQQKPVLAKIFLKPVSGWFEFNRELRGTEALLAAHIATPAIVYASYLKPSGVFIILFEFLQNATELSQCLESPRPQLERLSLLRQLVEMIAKQHQKGIIQTDLHLKNFLLTHNLLYSVDTAGIRLQKQPFSSKKSLNSLGLLLAQLTSIEDKLKEQVITWYFQWRNWSPNPEKLNYLGKQTAYWQKKREKTLRSKLFRLSTHFAAEKTARRFWVCDRNDLSEELLSLLRAPEYLFSSPQMRILKDGLTTTVGVIQIADRYFLVKRYNLKHFFHRLKRLITKTRAKKSWENAHRLLFRGIPTPRPVAMIENRHGMFRGVCYFMTEYIAGITASEYFKPHQMDLTQGSFIAQQILKILQDLTKERICHGDLKASNILLNEKGIWLIDLDAMRFYPHNFYFGIFKKQIQKDKKRFMRNWEDQPMLADLFK